MTEKEIKKFTDVMKYWLNRIKPDNPPVYTSMIKLAKEQFFRKMPQALDIIDQLQARCKKLEAKTKTQSIKGAQNEPNLGGATTGELLQELTARVEVDGSINAHRIIGGD